MDTQHLEILLTLPLIEPEWRQVECAGQTKPNGTPKFKYKML